MSRRVLSVLCRKRAVRTVVLGALLSGALVAAPAGATTRIERTFGTWVVNCTENGTQKTCALRTRAVTRENRIAFAWNIAMVEKQLTSQLLVPAGVSLSEGVRLAIGTVSPTTVAFTACGPRWCRADLPVDTALLNRIRGAQKAQANFVTGQKRLVQIELDLREFPKAYEYFYAQVAK